jgi:hypothetical protein
MDSLMELGMYTINIMHELLNKDYDWCLGTLRPLLRALNGCLPTFSIACEGKGVVSKS